MNTSSETGVVGQARLQPAGPIRNWVKGLALLMIGAAAGVSGSRLWSHHQEQQSERLARQQTEMLWREAVPRVEARLSALGRQIEDLDEDLAQAAVTPTAAGIELSRFRTQQRRLQMQMDETEAGLRRMTVFLELVPQQFGLRRPVPILSEDQEQILAGLQAGVEKARQDLHTIALEVQAVKERRLQLASLEAEAFRKAQAEAEVAQQMQAEAWQRAQALQPVAAIQNEDLRSSWLPASEPDIAPISCVQRAEPLISPYRLPLVIGSSYPNRRASWRYAWSAPGVYPALYPAYPTYPLYFRFYRCW
jgi:hypothetical protein